MSDQRLLSNPSGDLPHVGNGCWVSADARVVGRVELANNVAVFPFAVVRSDEATADGKCGKVIIGAKSNVQDGVAVHALAGTDVVIGENVSLAHHCVVHGPCTIGDNSFVGFHAVVFKARLGSGVFVSSSAIVQDVEVPDNLFVPPGARVLTQADVDALRTTTEEEVALATEINAQNQELCRGYRKIDPFFPAHRRTS